MKIALHLRHISAFSIICVGLPVCGATLCVNPGGSQGCYSSIQTAVNAAGARDTVLVAAGTYKESVTVSKSLSLVGDGAVINATGLPNGIYVNGTGGVLTEVLVKGFNVRYANFEGILVQNASSVTIVNNSVSHNDLSLNVSTMKCPGLPAWETAEDEDCGEGIHLVGVHHSIVSGNGVDLNSGGILLTDETGQTHDNLISGNTVKDNPYDCGITLAGHPQAGTFGTPLGVFRNIISGNGVTHNGFQVPGAGAGVGIFAFLPGALMGNNVVSGNVLTRNGLPGVAIHAHTPNENFDNNAIIGNTISGNGADTEDAATPGTAGINVYGASGMRGMTISGNKISGQDNDIVINMPAAVSIKLNNLLGTGVGVQNLGTGPVDAIANWWGCSGGPGMSGCSSVTPGVQYIPFLTSPAAD